MAQTKLGKRLLEIRKKIVLSGYKLLTWHEVLVEARRRRHGA